MDMELVLYFLPLLPVAAGFYFYFRRSEEKGNLPAEDVAGMNNPYARRRYIQNVKDVKDLEAAAEVWVGQGLSRDGLFYAEILERKEQLTGSLSDVEAMRVRRAHEARIEGAKLPPVKGRGRM